MATQILEHDKVLIESLDLSLFQGGLDDSEFNKLSLFARVLVMEHRCAYLISEKNNDIDLRDLRIVVNLLNEIGERFGV